MYVCSYASCWAMLQVREAATVGVKFQPTLPDSPRCLVLFERTRGGSSMVCGRSDAVARQQGRRALLDNNAVRRFQTFRNHAQKLRPARFRLMNAPFSTRKLVFGAEVFAEAFGVLAHTVEVVCRTLDAVWFGVDEATCTA